MTIRGQTQSLQEIESVNVSESNDGKLSDIEIYHLQDVKIHLDEKISIENLHLIDEKDEDIKSISQTTTTSYDASNSIIEDRIDIMPNSNMNVLRYDTYLSHQRYSDDYKHSNCNFVDFQLQYSDKKVIVEQQRSLGKGGLLWDAGVMIAEHLVSVLSIWNINGNNVTKVVELGAGTGFAGILIAKGVSNAEVTITDLPEVLPLVERNILRNIAQKKIINDSCMKQNQYIYRGKAAADIPLSYDSGCKELSKEDLDILYNHLNIEKMKKSDSYVRASVLRWGEKYDYSGAPYDVVFGGDIVTDLYCPKSLTATIYNLSHDKSHVFVSMKIRLSKPIEEFLEGMNAYFSVVKFVDPVTRRNNPEVQIMYATSKRKSPVTN